MSQIIRCGLIQCANPINDESVPVQDIQEAAFRLVRHNSDNQTYFCDPTEESDDLAVIQKRSQGLGAAFDIVNDRVVIWRKS